ncbi:MAG: efflux RND transporter periplasmic adaptor subunit [Deltaproteobacteria bacterium]|nr:efflux RND transporter periplasmic adaptor subunit [Deltaproteobacteria bacterium]
MSATHIQPSFRPSSAKKNSIGLMLAAGLISYTLFLGGCSGDDQAGRQAPPPPQVGVMALEPADVPLLVELPGRATAYNVSEVRPQVSGIILRRMFEEGSEVKKGQQLYQIDPGLYEANYETARATQKKAEAALTNAKLLADRYSKIVESNAVSRQEYDTAMANYRQAEAELASARAAVKTAKISLDYTRVFSPVAGRIGISSVTEGALVTAGQGSPLAYVQQMNPIYIDVVQSSTDYLKLQRNIKAGVVEQGDMGHIPVRLILEDGKEYDSEAALKLYDVTIDQSTGAITLRAEIKNDDRLILPGMFVRGIVNQGTIKGALLVPQQAVQRNQKGQPYALVVNESNSVEMRVFDTSYGVYENSWVVTPGLYDEKGQAISKEDAVIRRKEAKPVLGLLTGEKIIMEGSLRLRGGSSVTPVTYVPPASRNAQ